MLMDIKRIAVISYHTCPLTDEEDAEIGGMNTYILELSKALSKKGYVIDIYTRCVDKDSPKVMKVLKNLRVIHLGAGEPVKIPKKKLAQYIPEFIENLNLFIGKEKLSYDLISAHYYLSGRIGLELKNKYQIPLFITFHTLALMKNLVAKSEEEKEDFGRIKTEFELVKYADKVIATSAADREYIHALYNCPLSKISILTPGVDLKLFKPLDKYAAKKIIGADLNRKLILFVGRIEPLKGIDVILYAIKILVQKSPDLKICLWIVGGNKIEDQEKWSVELKRLEQIRQVLRLEILVNFVGKKDRNILPYYYNASEIVLMPSQYESFGITALEAMACGIPVIITDVAGVSGLFDKKHRSLLTSSSNPIRLAKKIKNLLLNEGEHKKMSEEVYKRVQDLSWDKLTDKFSQILSI